MNRLLAFFGLYTRRAIESAIDAEWDLREKGYRDGFENRFYNGGMFAALAIAKRLGLRKFDEDDEACKYIA